MMSTPTVPLSSLRSSNGRPRSSRSTEHGWAFSLAAGTLSGLAAGYLDRRVRRLTAEGLIDWARVEKLTAAQLARLPGALGPTELAAAEVQYAAAMRQIVPALERALGTRLPGVTARARAVSRAQWSRANLVTFRALFERLEAGLGSRLAPPAGDLGAGLLALGGRALLSGQLALMLSYLGARVLGQYDIALLAAETTPGQLLFVEENIAATAASLELPLADFRLWIALHETTHAFEFEAHPWLRPYLAGRLEEQLSGLLAQAQPSGNGLARWRAAKARANSTAGGSSDPGAGAAGLLDWLLDPAQRRAMADTQAVMSLLEGYADWVMDQVGAQLLPNVAQLRERFEARRARPKSLLEALMARLMGMDLKMSQYKAGERFVAGVAAIGGSAAVEHLWDGPTSLPSPAEISDPARWVTRVIGVGARPDRVLPSGV